MSGQIYIIKNFANNKIYIGQTTIGTQKRFQTHIQEAFDEKKKEYHYCLSRGIRKYGKQAFDVAVLANDVPADKLDIVEAHYIDMYKANDPDYGYNMSAGHRDNSNHNAYREMQPDEDYDPEKIHIDDISDEDITSFLEEFR